MEDHRVVQNPGGAPGEGEHGIEDGPGFGQLISSAAPSGDARTGTSAIPSTQFS